MKRVWAFVLCVCLLSILTSAASATANQIPVTLEAEFPAAVEELLLGKVKIENSERLTTANVQAIIDGCAQELAQEDTLLVPVSTDVVLKHPTLKNCATVECSAEFVYTTSFKQGVKYEWVYYPDGRVQKTLSYDYEERSSEFKTYTYTIVNHNNESLNKIRLEVAEFEHSLHTGDFLFGMAMAVLLMMIAAVIIRSIKKA